MLRDLKTKVGVEVKPQNTRLNSVQEKILADVLRILKIRLDETPAEKSRNPKQLWWHVDEFGNVHKVTPYPSE